MSFGITDGLVIFGFFISTRYGGVYLQLQGPDEANNESTHQNEIIWYKYYIKYKTSRLSHQDDQKDHMDLGEPLRK
jgi:hypothetical protein